MFLSSLAQGLHKGICCVCITALIRKQVFSAVYLRISDRTLSSVSRCVPRRDMMVQSDPHSHSVVRDATALNPPPFCFVPQEHSASGSDED